MKVAIPYWQGRVSPVFDVAGNVLLVEIDAAAELARRNLALDVADPAGRAARLMEAGADVLICGAISRPFELALTAAGIDVTAQICGDVECVLAAFIDGRLDQRPFRMPGCGRRGRKVRTHRRQGGQ